MVVLGICALAYVSVYYFLGSQLYSTQVEKPKQGNEKDEQQEPPVSHKEGPATDLYAMPDKEKDVLHTTSAGPVTREENAVVCEPKV